MTWRAAIDQAVARLTTAGVEDAALNAEYLSAHVLSLERRTGIRSFLDVEISSGNETAFFELVRRRILREPLQYILGEWEFYGLPIEIDSSALIPRPETELLVEQTIEAAQKRSKNISILDIGTGSGAIALALAKHLPDAHIVGIDSSERALRLARKNAESLQLGTVRFLQSDIFSESWQSPENKFEESPEKKFDLVVSNPPYISLEEFETLAPELRHFEPRNALTDEGDGLRFYRRIAELAPAILRPEGRLLVELGYGMAEAVSRIMQEAGIECLDVIDDLSGVPRVLIARL